MPESNQVSGGEGWQSYRSLFLTSLRYRNFRLFWFSSITEHIGEFMETAAILWLVNDLTHSPLMLTIVGASRYMPRIILPMIGGVVADRMNRRNVMIAALSASTLISISLAILAFTGLIAVWHLVVISLLSGVVMSFNHPAGMSLLPNLVKKEHLFNAISLGAISVQAARIIGMIGVGYFMVILGVPSIFAIRAASCLLAIMWLTPIRVPPTPPATREQTLWHNLVEGLGYLRSNTIILVMFSLYLVPLLVLHTYSNFMPVFAQDILHIGAVGYGYFLAAPGLGAILALVGLTMLTYYKGKVKLLFGAAVILGIAVLGFSASSQVFLSLPLLVVLGGMQSTFIVTNSTLIQKYVPDALRGRIMSLREIAFGLGTIGSILFGSIAQYIGVQFALGLLGVSVILVSFILILLSSRFKRLG